MKFLKLQLLLFTFLCFGNELYAQTSQDNLHGDVTNRARNVHAGNRIRTTFYNTGMMAGYKGDVGTYGGEWPKNTGQVQLGNSSPYIMAELRLFSKIDPVTGDSIFETITPAIFSQGWDPALFSKDSVSKFLGFEPLPGFLSQSNRLIRPNNAVAMSHQAYTWPSFWPDKTSDVFDPGWKTHWNGYFGKDQFNSDEESFFVMDDYQYKKRLKGLSLPKPMPTLQPERGGLGIRLAFRGLQWSNPDAQDAIFWIYRITNFGELNILKTILGTNVGASSGASSRVGGGSENADDDAKYYREKGLAVNYDNDNKGAGGYSPVPWVGFGFLESPGNALDGIDNDGDGDSLLHGVATGRYLEASDFAKFYTVGATIVTIDYSSPLYKRTLKIMPAEGIDIFYNGQKFHKNPNVPLIEIERNGIDDNLNGLIDEIDGAKIPDPNSLTDSITFYLYVKSEYNNRNYRIKDYFTGVGLDNPMIDERRDDGIDNDGDWDPDFDDVGLDGKPGTGDSGEGDHLPTFGNDQLPGEPNTDKVDKDESDQIGLTAFKYYEYGVLTYSNDDQMWNYSSPGYFDNKTTKVADYDYVFSSGFFPLKPNQDEFFSLALLFANNETEMFRLLATVKAIYNSNYNFAVAPLRPIVKAEAGDRKVTLYWDERAESSFDRYLRTYDFEGYKIYKSSNATFSEGVITDGFGVERYKKPVAVYDRIDSVFSFFPNDFGTGVKFFLGSETGLQHSFVDTDVKNGVRYFYAVTSFDKGDSAKNIGPSESTAYVSIDQSGTVQLGENVAVVTPEAPSAGYERAKFDIAPTLIGDGKTNGAVGINILVPAEMVEGDEYELHFLDTSNDSTDNDFDGLDEKTDFDEMLPLETTGFTLTNLSANARMDSVIVDTVMIHDYRKVGSEYLEIKNLYDDKDADPRTFSQILNNFEIFVNNPKPGVYTNDEERIKNGIQWSQNIDVNQAGFVEISAFRAGGFKNGTPYPRQYEVVFYNSLVDTSTLIRLPLAVGTGKIPVPATRVNFHVIDKQSGKRVKFGFIDQTVKAALTPAGYFSAKDKIILFETLPDNSTLITHQIVYNALEDSTFIDYHGSRLGDGDTVRIFPVNPFNKDSKYRFKVTSDKTNISSAKSAMNKIRVVPNPYVVTAQWELPNPYSNGRGERKIEFINLPPKCTIRIFTVDGDLVKALYHESNPLSIGSESWNLQSKDNMDVSYGIYIYHVEAPNVGEYVGRFLLMK